MKEVFSPRLLLILLAGVLLSSAQAPAQQNPIIETVTGPFPNSISEGAWVIRQPRVANHTDRDRTVRVVYRSWSPNFGKVQFSAPLTIRKGTAQTVTLPVWMQGMTDVGAGKGNQRNVEEICDLMEDRGGDEVQLDHHIVYKSLWKRRSVLAYCEFPRWEREEMPGGDASYLAVADNAVFGEDAVCGSVKPADLPDRWYGYSPVRVLLLGHFDPATLRQEQRRALLQWVRGGGTLVITGSLTAQDLLQGELAEAAGVCVQGVHSVSFMEAKGPEFTVSAKLKRPLPMLHLCVDGAEVVAESSGIPLLTRHRLDDGNVFVLAVPVGALAAGDLQRLWEPVAKAVREQAAVRNDQTFVQPAEGGFFKSLPAGSVLTAPRVLKEIAGRKAPVRAVPMVILLGLAGAVLLAGGVLMIRRRGEWVWVVLLPATLTIAVGLFLYGKGRTDEARLSYVGLMTGTSDSQATVQEAMAYYSGPAEGPPQFAGGNQEATIRMLPPLSGQATLSSVRTDMDVQMRLPVAIAPNDGRSFLVQSVISEQGVVGELTFGPKGLTGKLTSHLPAELSDAVVYVRRQAYRLGNLPKGGQTAVAINDTAKLGRDEFTGQDVKGPAETLRNKLLAQCVGRGSQVDPRAMVIGSMEHSPLDPLGASGAGVRRQGWTVVAWPLRFVPPDKGEVQVPSGFVEKSLGASSVYDPINGQFLPTHLAAEVRVFAAPPAVVGKLEAMQARLRVSIRATNYRLTVYGLAGGKGEGERTQLASFNNASGVYTVDIAEASKYSDGDGRCAVVLAVAPAEMATRAPGAGPANDAPAADWQLQSIDVSLEGKRP